MARRRWREQLWIGLLPATLLAGGAGAAEPPKTLAVRTAGLERQDGFIAFYWDALAGKLLLEVPRGGEEFLYGAGLAGGAGLLEVSLDRGQLGELGVCRFERVGPRVLLHQRQTAHRSGVTDPERSRVVEESFPDAVLASMLIEAEDGGRVLVDATDFLLRDPAIASALKQAQQGEWRQDRERSALHFARTGAFPRNTEIEAVLTFTADNPGRATAAVLPDGHTMTLRVHHTFLKLPEPGYTPRRLDPRIGFIPVPFKDHTAPFTEPIERWFVSRWRLQKRDAPGVWEPLEPIVYYLDRGMPEPERGAVREAALWWNHAFEEAGFKNALVVKDLPEGATFLDARYSGIEWINRAERAWSIGDAQVDPRTGEILHAVARIDSHRRRTTSRMWQNMTPPAKRLACVAAEAPDLSWLAAEAPGLDEESMVLARLRYLSAHEVGHTLGLMHNFAATTFGWGSVMDYLGPNVQLKATDPSALDLSDAYPGDVGSYDRLMIRWGYTPGEDPATLDRIVRDGYGRGNVYPLDGDPRWAEYDWGPDPVGWLRTTQQVRRVILDRFGVGQLKPGDPIHDLQVRFSLAYLYHRFGIQAAQQYVGGQFQTNALAGDGQTPVSWVPAAKQKEAVELLVAALAPENLDIPEKVLASLVPPPSGTSPTRERFPSEAGDTFSPLAAARSLAGLIVGPLLSADRAARLTVGSMASGSDALTLEGMIRRLVASTWGAPEGGPAPRLGALRRVGQRTVLEALLDLAASAEATPEVRATVMSSLVRLRADLRLRHSTDATAEAHLRLAERDLAEFLDQPELRKTRHPPTPAPPGRPIGSRGEQP